MHPEYDAFVRNRNTNKRGSIVVSDGSTNDTSCLRICIDVVHNKKSIWYAHGVTVHSMCIHGYAGYPPALSLVFFIYGSHAFDIMSDVFLGRKPTQQELQPTPVILNNAFMAVPTTQSEFIQKCISLYENAIKGSDDYNSIAKLLKIGYNVQIQCTPVFISETCSYNPATFLKAILDNDPTSYPQLILREKECVATEGSITVITSDQEE